MGAAPRYILEEEIFKKCVLDPRFIKDDTLPAGIVSTVVQNIMMFSGPGSIDQFNQQLDSSRAVASMAMHEMIPLICRAFPAYTPEQVYALKYEDFLLRLAQAESLLIKIGVLTQPLELLSKEAQAKTAKNKPLPQQLKRIWEQQHPVDTKATESPVIRAIQDGRPAKTTAPGMKAEMPIDFKKERTAIEAEMSGWDKADLAVEEEKMLKQAQTVYKDLIDKLPYYKQSDSTPAHVSNVSGKAPGVPQEARGSTGSTQTAPRRHGAL